MLSADTITTEPKSQTVNLTLFPKQDDFVHAQQMYVAGISGVGGGKTQGGAVKTLKIVIAHPGILGVVTAPTYRMLEDVTIRTVMELFPRDSYEWFKSDMRMALHNGSEILFRSTEDPDRLRGPNYGFFWMDEAALSPQLAFEILQGRLRQPGMPHQGWITTTPKGFNWVYFEFAREERLSYRMVRWTTRDNPYLPAEFLPSLEESYAEDFALQELEGQFVIVGGTAFFSPDALKTMLDDTPDPIEERLGGVVKIWKKPMVAGKYVAGGDLCWGETGAYSCMIIQDWGTGEQVAEIHGRLPQDEMAQEAVNLCKEYNNAYVGMERNGEGENVVNKMVELGYGHRMFWKDWETLHPDTPGWQTGRDTRPVMLGELEQMVRGLQIRPRCRDAVAEMMTFVRDDKGKPMHSQGAYDDHVIALAIANQMRYFARFRGSGVQVPFTPNW